MQSVKLESLKSAKQAVLALAVVGMCGVLFAQDAPTNFGSPPGAPQTAPKLTDEQLDTLVAPIALYPDALLSQIMMAATYPLEVVEANRWISTNSNLSGDAFADALNQQPWDPSVKSLTNTPTVLQMMDEKLDWTIKLGDAFLGQQPDVMGSVQRLRVQAQRAGNLQTTQQQRVTYEPNTDTTTGQPQQYIAIDDVDPDYAYVPVYDPFLIYGDWRYSHHPWFWHPHDYVATRGIWWGERYHYGPAWGYAWGRPDWARHDVEIDYRRNANYDPRFNRVDYLSHHPQLESHGGPAIWQHDPEHRLGVSYADPRIAQRYGGRTAAEDVRSREEYRGRVGASPQNLPNAHLPTLTNERLPNTEVHPQNDRAQDNRVQTDRAQNDRAQTDRAQNDRAQADARENAANDAARNASENAARDRENARNAMPTPQSHDDAPREVRPTPSAAPQVEQRSNSNADRGGAFNGASDRGGDAAADSARGEESRGGPHGSSGSEPAPARSSGGGGGGGSPHSGGSGGGARGGGSSGHR